MIAYVFIGIKLADIMMIWRIMRTMASMMIIRSLPDECHGMVSSLFSLKPLLMTFSARKPGISTPGQGRVGFALSQWVCCYDCFHKAQTQWQANGRSVNQQ